MAEIVDRDDVVPCLDQRAAAVRADEPRPARDHYAHSSHLGSRHSHHSSPRALVSDPRGYRSVIAMLNTREKRRLRVLIVDDYPIARRMFTTGLAAYGVDSCEAGDAAEALAVAAQQSPDVVVLDLFLAGSSGLEVARELRARQGGDRLVLIALSGHAGDEYRQRAAE